MEVGIAKICPAQERSDEAQLAGQAECQDCLSHSSQALIPSFSPRLSCVRCSSFAIV